MMEKARFFAIDAGGQERLYFTFDPAVLDKCYHEIIMDENGKVSLLLFRAFDYHGERLHRPVVVYIVVNGAGGCLDYVATTPLELLWVVVNFGILMVRDDSMAPVYDIVTLPGENTFSEKWRKHFLSVLYVDDIGWAIEHGAAPVNELQSYGKYDAAEALIRIHQQLIEQDVEECDKESDIREFFKTNLYSFASSVITIPDLLKSIK